MFFSAREWNGHEGERECIGSRFEIGRGEQVEFAVDSIVSEEIICKLD